MLGCFLDSFPHLEESVLVTKRWRLREKRDTQHKEATSVFTEFTSGQRLDQGKRANTEAKGGSVSGRQVEPSGWPRALAALPGCTLPGGGGGGGLLSWDRALPRVQLPSAHSIFFDAWSSRQDRQNTNCSLLIEDDIGISSHSPRPDCPTERGEKERGGE